MPRLLQIGMSKRRHDGVIVLRASEDVYQLTHPSHPWRADVAAFEAGGWSIHVYNGNDELLLIGHQPDRVSAENQAAGAFSVPPIPGTWLFVDLSVRYMLEKPV